MFVDGRFTGVTPTEISGLAAGRHRVHVVKAGYLENARFIDVSDAVTTVRIRLTPDTSAAGQVTSTSRGGSGGALSNKWLWIGAAAAGAGIAVALAAKTENAAPLVGSVEVSPTNGLQGATVISVRAVGATDPDDDPLTYTWDFGDGSTATGETATHQYSTAGTFTVSVKISDGQKTATASGSVSITSLTGNWRGANAVYTLTITHAGSVVQVVWDDIAGGLARRWVGMGNVAAPRDMTAT